MTTSDLAVVGVYFLFIVGAALCFRRFVTHSGHFVNGGGAMMWWMSGATAFMTQFSAWTFTGAAAKAYTDGLAVLLLFWGNALGFMVAAAFFAARYRKMRVETAMEVVRLRFGRGTELLFTWLQFPLSLIGAAIWLNGLAIFVSAVFDVPVIPTLLVTGSVVTFIAASGGSWTVSATNVVQLVLLLAVTLVTGCYALIHAGGPAGVITRFPADFVTGTGMSLPGLFALWGVAMFLRQTTGINDVVHSYRFLVTRNEQEASKAALLAGVLFIIGPVLWFVPPWVVAGEHMPLATLYPSLGKDAANAAYLGFVQQHMPAGTLGLFLAAMLAATIAPMSTMLNRNAGFVVRSLCTHTRDETALLRLARWVSLVNGLLATAAAIGLAMLPELGLFDLMMIFSAMLQMPLSMPAVLSVIVQRTPDWSGWSTVLVGAAVSLFMQFGFDPAWLADLWGSSVLSHREAIDLRIATTVFAHLLITGGWFCASSLFHRDGGARNAIREGLFRNMRTPLRLDEQAGIDERQGRYLGAILMLAGAATLVLSVLEAGDSRFAVMAALIGASGFALFHRARAAASR